MLVTSVKRQDCGYRRTWSYKIVNARLSISLSIESLNRLYSTVHTPTFVSNTCRCGAPSARAAALSRWTWCSDQRRHNFNLLPWVVSENVSSSNTFSISIRNIPKAWQHLFPSGAVQLSPVCSPRKSSFCLAKIGYESILANVASKFLLGHQSFIYWLKMSTNWLTHCLHSCFVALLAAGFDFCVESNSVYQTHVKSLKTVCRRCSAWWIYSIQS